MLSLSSFQTPIQTFFFSSLFATPPVFVMILYIMNPLSFCHFPSFFLLYINVCIFIYIY
ncbi:hypothetical protein BDF21DRAFT_415096 [Thamnidium elegans]|nr:hypothetical protein BDF21DRAFT_415096 [Thamnidium elegans]